MGLKICKNICEQLEGNIEVQSILGKGSVFTFKMRAKKSLSNLTIIDEESKSFSERREEIRGEKAIDFELKEEETRPS